MKVTKIAVVVYDIETETAVGADRGYEPIGAMMIVGALIQAGFEAQLFARSLYSSLDELTMAVIDWKPKLVGFSTMSCNICQSVKMGEVLEETLGVPMIFGGWHTSGVIWHYQQNHHYPDLWQFLMKENRYGVFGEGIRTMPELVLALQAKSGSTGVPGVCYMGDNGKLVVNPPYPRLSPEKWPEIPYDQYPMISGRRTIVTGQGCRNACRYCQTPILYRGCQRLAPQEAAIRTARMINEDPEIRILWDTNEDFTGDREWLKAFCWELARIEVDRRALCTFANGRDFRDEEAATTVAVMADCGWGSLLVGIETPDRNILRDMNRATDIENTARLCHLARDAGIETIGALMIGYPNQEEVELRQSLGEVAEMFPVNRVYISFLIPLPGTPLYHDCRQKGLIRKDVPLEHWTGVKPVINTTIPPATLKAIRLEFISHYRSKGDVE